MEKDSNIISTNVKKLTKDNGLTIDKLADKLKVEVYDLKGRLYGKVRWDADILKKLATFFAVSIDSLFGMDIQSGIVQPKKVSIPFVADVKCGEPLSQWSGYGEKFYELDTDIRFTNPVMVRARGDSMENYIVNGDLVVFEDVGLKRIKTGDIVLVNFFSPEDTKEGIIKFIKFEDNEMLNLYSANTKYPPHIVPESDVFRLYRYAGLVRFHKYRK